MVALAGPSEVSRVRRSERPAGHEFRWGFGLAQVCLAAAHVRHPFQDVADHRAASPADV